MSNPSRSRLIPTTTSMWPIRKALRISVRSMVSISEWRWCDRTPIRLRYSATSSANLIVKTVTRQRSPFSIRRLISESKSATWPSVGRTSMFGSSNPVGRNSIFAMPCMDCNNSYMVSESGCFFFFSPGRAPPAEATCSRPRGTFCLVTSQRWRSSRSPGVADTYTICGTRCWNSGIFNGRLSAAVGKRNPCSMRLSFRDLSPKYMPPTCGSVTCDSSMMTRNFFGSPWNCRAHAAKKSNRQ